MKRLSLVLMFGALLAVILLVAATRVKANTLTINSADYNDGTENLAPYHGTLTADALTIQVQTFCIELNATVGFGQAFDVTVVSLQNYEGPLKTEYWEAGWLALQITNYTQPGNVNVGAISDINRAIWFLTTPDAASNPYLNTVDVHLWLNAAQANYQSLAQNDVTLYLRDGAVGQNQLSVVPEPSIFAMMIVAFGSLIGFNRLRRRA